MAERPRKCVCKPLAFLPPIFLSPPNQDSKRDFKVSMEESVMKGVLELSDLVIVTGELIAGGVALYWVHRLTGRAPAPHQSSAPPHITPPPSRPLLEKP